jgi:hypothetical protein
VEVDYITQVNAIVSRAVAEAEARGYALGKADARREILAILNNEAPRAPATPPVARPVSAVVTDKPDVSHAPSGRKRAPKGIVPKFVTRVLTELPGLTPREIFALRIGADEEMIKPDSIRGELNLGSRSGRYRTQGGKWFLSSEAEGQSVVGQPSASDSESDDDAAALI